MDWEPIQKLLALLSIFFGTVIVMTTIYWSWHPREYGPFYLDRISNVYYVKQYVRYGVDVDVFASTDAMLTFTAYMKLLERDKIPEKMVY